MMDNNKVLKLIFAWIVGVSGVIFGLMAILKAETLFQKFFTVFFIITNLYIIPKVNNLIWIKIRTKYVTIAFLISFLGMLVSSAMKPNENLDLIDSNKIAQFYVKASKLNVRNGMGLNHKVLYKLSEGDMVEMLSQNEEWAEIQTSQGKGYVSLEYLTSEKDDVSGEPNWVVKIIVIGLMLYFIYYNISKEKSISSLPKSQYTNINSNSNNDSPKPKFVCKDCGKEFNRLSDLISSSCSKSSTGMHIPFEGGAKSSYPCKDCGKEFNRLSDLISSSCNKSLTGIHRPLV